MQEMVTVATFEWAIGVILTMFGLFAGVQGFLHMRVTRFEDKIAQVERDAAARDQSIRELIAKQSDDRQRLHVEVLNTMVRREDFTILQGDVRSIGRQIENLVGALGGGGAGRRRVELPRSPVD